MDIKAIRQRMGWSQSDLARRLHCKLEDIATWESGDILPQSSVIGELEIISHQAEACCDELHFAPMAEEMLIHSDLGQIEISRVKEQIQ